MQKKNENESITKELTKWCGLWVRIATHCRFQSLACMCENMITSTMPNDQ